MPFERLEGCFVLNCAWQFLAENPTTSAGNATNAVRVQMLALLRRWTFALSSAKLQDSMDFVALD